MIPSRQSRVSGIWICTLQLFFSIFKSVSPVTQRICTWHKLPHRRNEGTASFFYWRAVQVLFTCLFSSAYFLFCPHVAATSSLGRFCNSSISWNIFLTSCMEMAFSGLTKYFTIMAPWSFDHSHFWELSVSVGDATQLEVLLGLPLSGSCSGSFVGSFVWKYRMQSATFLTISL